MVFRIMCSIVLSWKLLIIVLVIFWMLVVSSLLVWVGFGGVLMVVCFSICVGVSLWVVNEFCIDGVSGVSRCWVCELCGRCRFRVLFICVRCWCVVLVVCLKFLVVMLSVWVWCWVSVCSWVCVWLGGVLRIRLVMLLLVWVS